MEDTLIEQSLTLIKQSTLEHNLNFESIILSINRLNFLALLKSIIGIIGYFQSIIGSTLMCTTI